MFVGPIMGKFLDYSHPIYRSTCLASFGLTVLHYSRSSRFDSPGGSMIAELSCEPF